MNKTSFLARKSLGQPRYLLIAVACAFVLSMVPWGAWRALDSSSNNAEAWLPPAYDEVQDLTWFRDHFRGELFALVSWDGCTLGEPEQLELLAKKLTPTPSALAAGGADSPTAQRARWYSRVTTGPRVIHQLMESQLGVNYNDAIKRLEGALVGPPQRDALGRTQGNESRTTCLIVYLTPEATQDSRTMRAAVAEISDIAANECGINAATIHMGGPPVDNATIDAEGQRTLVRLASLAGIVGLGLCYWRLRSVRLTAIVFAVGAASAGLSLAMVFYYGVFEVLMLGRTAPTWGTLDAVLMAMPAIVYLLAMSAALHAVNYYLSARREQSATGAAEKAVRLGWRPTALAAFAAAGGVAALATSDIVPIQKFGFFTAISALVTVGVVFALVPMLLHRYPLSEMAIRRRAARSASSRLAKASRGVFGFVAGHNSAMLGAWAIALVVLAAGMWRLETSVQILGLLDRNSDLVQDYAWLERNLGNLMPMEVVLTMPPERLRAGDEHAEQDGQQYRLTMLERLELLRQIGRKLEGFPQISRALSAATFAPASTATGLNSANRGGDYAKNKALEYHRDRLLAGDYLRMERESGSDRTTGRELWRLNARVAALTADDAPIDYSAFLGQLQRAVEPVLMSYQQRDQIVSALHEQGKQLAGSHVCVLFRAPNRANAPPADVQEQTLAELLCTSGVAPRGVTYFNLAVFESPGRGDAAQDEQYRQSALASLRQQDAVVLASAHSDPAARQIAHDGVYVVDVTDLASSTESIAQPLADDGAPRPIRAVFTGPAPIVERTQRQLLGTLERGLIVAGCLVTGVVTLGLMSAPAGLLAMLPCLFPLVATLGVMGWLGVKVDLGVAMTAGVALALAAEGTIHFVNWFRQGMSAGLNRRDAVMRAYDLCGGAMVETALIAGAGLAVLSLSAFTPLREVGSLSVAMLTAALAGNLLLLPAMLASPLGWFFAPAAIRKLDPLWPRVQARLARRSRHVVVEPELLPLPQPKSQQPRGPHFGDETVPAKRTPLSVSSDERRELADGPHSALHAKLQGLRRGRAGDSQAS